MQTLQLKLPEFKRPADLKVFEHVLKSTTHITEVVIDKVDRIATITYHDKLITPQEILDILRSCGFRCKELPMIISKNEENHE